MSTATMPLAQLVEDLSVYPRAGISDVNVHNLALALKAGAKLPLMIVDQDSKRIIDGFHRRRALAKVLGSAASVKVQLESYATEAEMLAAAVSMNTDHGLPLGQIERRQAVQRLSDMGVDDNAIGIVLRIPPVQIQRFRVQVATVVNEKGAPIRVEPLKRPLLHFQGKAMTEPQAVAQRSAPGSSYVLLCHQLRDAMQYDLINQADGRAMAALRALLTQLEEYLAP